jgi:hypothetical protein
MMIRATITINPEDIVSMEYISQQQFREIYKREVGALISRMSKDFQRPVFWTWKNSRAVIRPWSTWNIPATRCQRIRGKHE